MWLLKFQNYTCVSHFSWALFLKTFLETEALSPPLPSSQCTASFLFIQVPVDWEDNCHHCAVNAGIPWCWWSSRGWTFSHHHSLTENGPVCGWQPWPGWIILIMKSPCVTLYWSCDEWLFTFIKSGHAQGIHGV